MTPISICFEYKLGYDLLRYIARFAEDKDLCSLGKTSKLFHRIVLREMVNRECFWTHKQLKKLDDLSLKRCINSNQKQKSLECYKQFVRALAPKNFLAAHLDVLTAKLTHLAATVAEKEILKAKKDLYQSVEEGKASLEQIRRRTSSVETRVFHQAYELLIGASLDPLVSRTKAVTFAEKYQQADMVYALIKNGPIKRPIRKKVLDDAARNGHLLLLKELLKQEDLLNEDVGEALFQASRSGCIQSIELLLDHRFVDASFIGRALINPARQGNVQLVNLLLGTGKVSGKNRGTATVEAAMVGQKEIIKILIEDGPIPLGRRGWAVETAANNGHLEIIQLLLSKGDISEKSRGLALLNAAAKGRVAIVTYLLTNGALDPKYVEKAIQKATDNQDFNVVSALTESQNQLI